MFHSERELADSGFHWKPLAVVSPIMQPEFVDVVRLERRIREAAGQLERRIDWAMIIQFKKGRDGPSTLACVRADGSRTWSRLHSFFPLHDLTHCAVESVLGIDQAFFGLVGAGWEIDDFARPGSALRLPPDALRAERIVGLLDLERASGRLYEVAEFDAAAPGGAPLTSKQLAAIRSLRDELHGRWLALARGHTLELPFPVMPLTSTV